MAYCPECKSEWEDDITECPICGRELVQTENEQATEWVVLGVIEDKVSADYARETLKSYEIPSVVISKSGFFGEIGLTLNPFYSTHSPLFEISVLSIHVEEAAAILDMAIGEKWQRKES